MSGSTQATKGEVEAPGCGETPDEGNARVEDVRRTIQVRAFRGERQYVAECLDLPVVTQAATLDELAENIREAVGLHLEGENLADLGLAPDRTITVTRTQTSFRRLT